MSVDIVENSYGMQREIACEVANRNTSAICSKLTNQSAQRLTCSNADRDATSCCAADCHATCRCKTSCSNTDRCATSCYATSSYATSSYYMQFETRFWGLCVSRQILLCISKVGRILGATIELLCCPSKLRCRNGFNENVCRLRRICFFLLLIIAVACIAASERGVEFPQWLEGV
jgi:hypothetical protein